MKKSLAVSLVVMSTVFGFTLFMGPSAATAADVATVEAKVASPAKDLTFNATAYIAGHGGHLAIIDMNKMAPPTDMEKGRIVLTEAGSEMEGKIAGMSFEEVSTILPFSISVGGAFLFMSIMARWPPWPAM